MATYTWMSAPSIATDAAYRAWGKGMHDAFVAMGLVQTADTGQVNWATAVLGSTVANTPWGYEVFRFNDALQATVPVFIKVEYGRGAAASPVDNPTMWVQAARSTNGAGTLGADAWSVRANMMGGGAFGGATAYQCFASGTDGGLGMVLHPSFAPNNAVSPVALLVVERTRDSLGASTGDGLMLTVGSPTSNRLTYVTAANGVAGSSLSSMVSGLGVFHTIINGVTMTTTGVAVSNTAGASEDLLAVNLVAITLLAPGVTPWASKVIMWAHPGDAVFSSVITVPRYGASHQYRLFQPVYLATVGLPLFGMNIGNPAGCAFPALLWDA